MLTVENEYFIRLLLLILKGGTAVQKKVLIERLRKDDMQLKDFLLSNQKEIDKLKEDKVLTLKQYNILFPSNGTPSDFNNYDISLLSCLLLNIFSLTLTKRQEKAIQNIRTLRNEFLAHHPNDSIDVRTFFRKWNQLHQSIDNLRQDLSDETSQELEDIIRCVVNDPIDIKQAIQDIKVATDNSDLFIEHVSRQLENLSVLVQRIYRHQEDTCTAIEELQKQNENRNMSCVIIGEVTVSSKNPEAAIEAAKILLENSKASTESITNKDSVVNNGRTTKIVKSINSSFDGLFATSATTTESTDTDSSSQSSVAALVQDINDTGGEVVHVTEGSVLLHIQCNSVLVVFNVLNFFKSSTMEQRLNTIAECLSHKVGSCIQLSAHIQEESLCETLRFLQQNEHPEYMKKVRFSIKYQSMEGVLKVVKLMEGEEWKNDITTVSKFLSDEVGCPVTLSASLDKVPLQQYIVEAREHDNDKESAEKAEMLCWADAWGNEKEKEMEMIAVALNRPKEFSGEKEDTIVDMPKIQIDTQVTSIVKDQNILQKERNKQCQRRIILVGKTGNGKSSTANSILLGDAFAHQDGAYAVTETCMMECGINNDNSMIYFVVDTPGLLDTRKSVSERALEIQRSVDICPEPHAFLLVFSANNLMTTEERFTIDMLRIMFGECMFNHSIVVFTHGNNFESDLAFQQFWTQNAILRELINLCKNRVVKIENTTDYLADKEGTQRIFEMIEHMSDAGETVYRYKGLKTHRSIIEETSKKYRGKGDIHEEVSEMVREIGEKMDNKFWKTMLYGGVLIGTCIAVGFLVLPVRAVKEVAGVVAKTVPAVAKTASTATKTIFLAATETATDKTFEIARATAVAAKFASDLPKTPRF